MLFGFVCFYEVEDFCVLGVELVEDCFELWFALLHAFVALHEHVHCVDENLLLCFGEHF